MVAGAEQGGKARILKTQHTAASWEKGEETKCFCCRKLFLFVLRLSWYLGEVATGNRSEANTNRAS